MGHLGRGLEALGDVLVPSWGVLRGSWSVIGRSRRLPGIILGGHLARMTKAHHLDGSLGGSFGRSFGWSFGSLLGQNDEGTPR